MARPITWQNVNAPQGALSIEALLRSGRQAGEGFEAMGDVFRTARDEMQQAATGAAVAQIANSADPLAAAAQAPKTWQFDPLAINAAANAREGQLFTRKVGESNLRENEAQITNLESEMEDRESLRSISTLIAPYEALARAGKKYDVDEASDPLWKSKAGFEAKKHLEGLYNTAINQQQENERTAIQGRQARAAEDALKRSEAERKTRDRFVNFMQTTGAGSGLAEQQRVGRLFAEEEGAGTAYGATMPELYGNARGVASTAELEAPTNLGITGNEAIARQQRRVAVAEANEASTLASWEPYMRLGQEYDVNPFQGKDDFTSAKALRGLVEGAEGKGIIPIRYGDDDLIERVDQLVDWGLRNNTPIDRDQAWMLVGKTIGEVTFYKDKTDKILNDGVKRDIELLHNFNQMGRTEGLKVKVGQQKAQTDLVRRDAGMATATIHSALINGQPLPRTVIPQIGGTGSWEEPKKNRGASAGY